MKTSPAALLLVLAIATLLGTAACVPIPHTVRLTPELQGQYHGVDGGPVAGAMVAVSTRGSDRTCAHPARVATTGADGRYTLASVTRRETVYILLPVDELFCYTVCSGRGGAPFTAGTEHCSLHRVAREKALDCTERPGDQPGTVITRCGEDERASRSA
jgi:hypothetical protein